MDTPYVVDPRIAAYVAELNQQSVVSYSHRTLRYLYQEHGTEVIDQLLNEHWAAVNPTKENATC